MDTVDPPLSCHWLFSPCGLGWWDCWFILVFPPTMMNFARPTGRNATRVRGNSRAFSPFSTVQWYTSRAFLRPCDLWKIREGHFPPPFPALLSFDVVAARNSCFLSGIISTPRRSTVFFLFFILFVQYLLFRSFHVVKKYLPPCGICIKKSPSFFVKKNQHCFPKTCRNLSCSFQW